MERIEMLRNKAARPYIARDDFRYFFYKSYVENEGKERNMRSFF